MTAPEPAGLGYALAKIQDQDERLKALAVRVAQLDARTTAAGGGGQDEDEPGYTPRPAARWWELDGDARLVAVAALRAWVTEIYVPGYGKLAAALPSCWPEHPFALYTLDWLSELWSVLWLQPKRTSSMLSGQAEFTTRYLPAAADLISREAKNCDHVMTPRANGAVR